MRIIAHRGFCGKFSRKKENSLKTLYDGLLNFEGVETDIRFNDFYGIYIAHNHLEKNKKPFLLDSFIEYLEKNISMPFKKKKYLFLNVKEDNLAININKSIIGKLDKLNINTYFFDMSNPDFLNYVELFPENIVFRISELENSNFFRKTIEKYGTNRIRKYTFWVDTFWGFDSNLENLIRDLISEYPLSEFVIVDPKLHNKEFSINSNILENKRIILLKDI